MQNQGARLINSNRYEALVKNIPVVKLIAKYFCRENGIIKSRGDWVIGLNPSSITPKFYHVCKHLVISMHYRLIHHHKFICLCVCSRAGMTGEVKLNLHLQLLHRAIGEKLARSKPRQAYASKASPYYCKPSSYVLCPMD